MPCGTPIELTILLHARKMGTPRLAMRMGAVLEDEACHEDFSIGIGRRDVLKHIPEYHIRFTILSQ